MTARQLDDRVASGLLVTFELLTATLERLGGPGRNGAGVLRALVEERDPATAPTHSVLEDRLFRLLRRNWHGGRLDVGRNTDKANRLLAHGWRVLRFTGFDVTRRARYVIDAVEGQLVAAWPA